MTHPGGRADPFMPEGPLVSQVAMPGIPDLAPDGGWAFTQALIPAEVDGVAGYWTDGSKTKFVRTDRPAWSWDTDAALTLGSRVQSILTLDVLFPRDSSRGPGAFKSTHVKWLRAADTRNGIEAVWDAGLRRNGKSTRMRVLTFRQTERMGLPGWPTNDGWVQQIELEVVGEVRQNIAIGAALLIAFLVAALIDISVNGATILKATGEAVGTFLRDVVDPLIPEAGTIALVLAGLGAVLLGAWLVFR